jgi:FemAB-related protein (PEP-CTERM system-associated)
VNADGPQHILRELTEQGESRWDAYVEKAPAATFFHRAGWRRVIEKSFSHKTYYVYVEKAGAVTGVLPLVHLKSRLFGSALVSIPFAVYGGPVADDPAAHDLLDAHALELANKLDVEYLEYRSREPSRPDWACRDDLYFTFRRAIEVDPEKNLKAIPRKQRAVVRQSLEKGLEAVVEETADTVYAVYAESVRNLGTPVFARKYFRNLKQEFGKDCELLAIRKDGKPVSGVLSFYFRDEVLPYYGGGTFDARKLGANDLMYWDLMRRAGQAGYRVFDFGRSKAGTGAFSFKKNWGFTPVPLHYEYRLRRIDGIPDHNPLNPKYRLMIAAWKRLPLPVANTLGPFIVRNLG